jgi:hypothetical protein
LPTPSEALTLRVQQALIALLFIGGLVFAGLAISGKPRPEVVIETCSFAAALLLVAREHQRTRRTKRVAALTNIAREMQRNAEALYAEQWLLGIDVIQAQFAEPRRGLRFYYPHLATIATGGALLGDALDHRRDSTLIRQLQLWQEAAGKFNTRATMAEFLLFFLPATDECMLERLEVHVTISTETVSTQRDELDGLVTAIAAVRADRKLARSLAGPITTMREVLEQRIAADDAANALNGYLAQHAAEQGS